MSWKAKLIRPIEAEEGDLIVTLSDAREYLLKLPKTRHKDPLVQATIQALLMAAEGHGPILVAQSGMAQVVQSTPAKKGAETMTDQAIVERAVKKTEGGVRGSQTINRLMHSTTKSLSQLFVVLIKPCRSRRALPLWKP